MDVAENNKKVASGLIWKFGERIGAQAVTFVVSIILARLLAPADYGLIAIVTLFISIANVFVVSGFGNSLIQNKDADDLDFSTVFYFQLVLSIFLYGILFFIAPLITKLYGSGYALLTPVLRVLGLRLPISAINNVQQAYVARKMIFGKFFISTLSGTVLSAVVGIWMAYAGYGVWALVGQYLTNAIIGTIVLGMVIRWKPKAEFSFQRLRPLAKYGWKLLLVDLINTIGNTLRGLLIGKVYSKEDLAYYERGEQFPSIIVTNINSSIQTVLFPAMANMQDRPSEVKEMLRNFIRMGSFIIFPLVFGLLAVAESVVTILLTEKWLICVPYLQLFCVAYSLRIISTSCGQSIKALGRSDLYMQAAIIYKIFEFLMIFATMFISVQAVAIGVVLDAFILLLIQYIYNYKLLKYKLMELIKDLLPNIILSVIMVACVWLLNTLSIAMIWKLLIQVASGAVIYLGGAFLLKNQSMLLLIEKLRGKKARRKCV